MEVVAANPSNGGVPPFHDHDVREWSRINSLTGVLERARLETDQWTTNIDNAIHKYNKVVDCRSRTNTDGALQQKARRQLEVFQSRIPGGQLQVIKTHTVSSSRWTNKGPHEADNLAKDFESLQLPLNSLDLTTQKSKAVIGRNASKRPPSRTRLKDDPPNSNFRSNPHATAAANLQRVSRLCHQIHETAVKQAFGKFRKPIHERENGDGSVQIVEIESITNDSERPPTEASRLFGDVSEEITEDNEERIKIDAVSDTSNELTGSEGAKVAKLTRSKSSSSEDLTVLSETTKSIEDLEDLEQLQNWRRSSKIRRSLQYPQKDAIPKTFDFPVQSVSVRKVKEDLEKGRRLNTALRGNNVDLQALDYILQSISSSSSLISEAASVTDEPVKKPKRNSFVTVETLNEVKSRLRRTSIEADADDGIATEGSNDSVNYDNRGMSQSKVRSYVYGMETLLSKKPMLGTGSLESRTKLSNGLSNNRNEDWYNRRKSYGFEKVHTEEDGPNISRQIKNQIESSTDSGICRSNEIVIVPSSLNKETDDCSENDDNYQRLNSTTKISNIGNVKRIRTLFSNFGSETQPTKLWNKDKELKSTTITIPITSNDARTDSDPRVLADIPSFAIHNRYGDDMANSEDINGKRSKKVEFCKTEVHFAAESGKVNIVETDEKPPPTQNFRRRRRHSGSAINHLDGVGHLPVLHFGDSPYEKALLGVDAPKSNDDTENIYENLSTKTTVPIVTVNVGKTETHDEKRASPEGDIKGILKNKPLKPRPYLLGDPEGPLSSISDDDSRWRTRLENDPPIWKSTVTLRNTFFDEEKDGDRGNEPEFQKLLRNLKPVSPSRHFPQLDNRRASWSSTDKIRVDEKSWIENKGYSTKVNIRGDEATVVENDLSSQADNDSNEQKQILNQGLIVRIGRENSSSKHLVCSKITSDPKLKNTTTTTKITIDLTNSSAYCDNHRSPNTKYDGFKSTSLILNTIKQQTEAKKDSSEIPRQLEALRKLYEDAQSDSDADKEVQSLMNGAPDKELGSLEDKNSVVSGSWSRLKAFRTINGILVKTTRDEENYSKRCTTKAQVEKGTLQNDTSYLNRKTYPGYMISRPSYNSPPDKGRLSPVVLRKNPKIDKIEVKTAETVKTLSSPSLVAKNGHINSDSKKGKEFKNVNENIRNLKSEYVLRQPKKSEMTYFGVPSSPKSTRKLNQSKLVDNKSSETPDLLQHRKVIKSKPTRKKHEEKLVKEKTNELDSPIYENIDNVLTQQNFDDALRDNPPAQKYSTTREFDSSILDELTRAADEILQAVNGFSDDDSQVPTPKPPLDTIAETKCWKQQKPQARTSRLCNSKPKLKHTSSTSSVDSTREVKRAAAVKKATADKDKSRGRSSASESSTKANTKARRLQRASSREALLQSHGSSSEDLGANAEPVRKPRLIRKTKTSQFTISNGIELHKKGTHTSNAKRRDDVRNKQEESRLPAALPEIRHKTAVSTIRSTADKSKEKSKTRPDDNRRKPGPVKETTKATDLSARKSMVPKETVNHRISTANIKKCHRSEGATSRH